MAIPCPKCKQDTLELPDAHGHVSCRCNPAKASFEYFRFPAYFKDDFTITAETVTEEGASTCYNHPDKAAAAACASCGMFACQLCLVDSPSGQICLNCLNRQLLEGGVNKSKNVNSHSRKVAYDTIALNLAFVPILFFWICIVTAPIVLFLSIRYWNRPCSDVPRNSKLRFAIATFFALLQLFGMVMLIIALGSGTF